MSAKRNLVAAYNTLQKRIFKSKAMKGKSHEAIRIALGEEWKKLKASSNFTEDMKLLMDKYKPLSNGKNQVLLMMERSQQQQIIVKHQQLRI